MTIDIYEQGNLAYNSRKAIRNLISTPTVAGVSIKHFDHGDGSNSAIVLDETPNIKPEKIKYVVLKSPDEEDKHYYVTGFQFISQRRFQLSLLRNAWFRINKHQNAHIQRSSRMLTSILAHKPEPGLNFNKIKTNEILVKDQYGNGPWGVLYLNKTESPLSAALNDIKYSNEISGGVPHAPGEPVKQEDDSYLAFYNDYHLRSTPEAPDVINGGKAYLYDEITVDVTNTPNLPLVGGEITEPVVEHKTTTVSVIGGPFGASTRLFASYKPTPTLDHFYGCYGDVSPNSTITYDETGTITAATGSVLMTYWSPEPAYRTPWEAALKQSYSTHKTAGSARSAIISIKKVFNVKDTGSHPFSNFVVGTKIQGFEGAAFTNHSGVPTGRTVSSVPPAGVYRSGGKYREYTPELTPQSNVVTNTGTLNVGNNNVTDPNIIAMRWARADDQNNFIHPLVGFEQHTTYSYSEISMVPGDELYPQSVRRRTYNAFTIDASDVTCSDAGAVSVYNDHALTNSFIEGNLPEDTEFWAISSTPTFSNPGIEMPSASAFETEGLAEVFTHNNVRYTYSPYVDLEGVYIDNDKAYEVKQEDSSKRIKAPLNYNITVPSYQTSTFGLAGKAYPGSTEAEVDLSISLIGSVVEVPTTLDAVISVDEVNNNTIVSEPYAVLVMPLFDVKYSLDGAHIKQNNLVEAQKVFYELIRMYSGTGQVADAQIIPFAPKVFADAYNNDATNGVWINMQHMNRVGKMSDGEELNNVPFVALDRTSFRFSFYYNTNPYENKRKEATLRSMRLCSPNYDSIFEFGYYDFNNSKMKWTEHNDADSRLDISVTLKPFNTYVRAMPYIGDNTLMGSSNALKDLRGLICGSSIFEATMTSSAFETYKRQNTMYEQIQERQVESMSINHKVERESEAASGILGTLQATAMGALSGAALSGGGKTGAIGAIGGAALAGGTSAIAYGAQYAQNEKLRSREAADQKFYYEANIANIKAQPDSLNRVSSLNADILRMFSIVIEQYACTGEEADIYDKHVKAFGHSINIVDDLYEHLIDGKYVEGQLISSELAPHIHQRLDEDLRKGVYYYEQI